jgi:hypothetical protein
MTKWIPKVTKPFVTMLIHSTEPEPEKLVRKLALKIWSHCGWERSQWKEVTRC